MNILMNMRSLYVILLGIYSIPTTNECLRVIFVSELNSNDNKFYNPIYVNTIHYPFSWSDSFFFDNLWRALFSRMNKINSEIFNKSLYESQ